MRRVRLPPLTGDLLAGLSVAVVAVPQSLAYAELAGMPPFHGLYAAALPPIAAALFASSPYLMTGPVAVTALLAYGALANMATPGSPEYVTLGAALALLVGVVRVGLGLARAGWVAYLMSQPVLLGFVPAAALLIAASQTPSGLGVNDPPDYDSQVAQAAWALAHPSHWDTSALVITGATVGVILVGRWWRALFPGVLVCAVGATVASASFDYDGDTLNEVPSGFPPFTLDDLPWDRMWELALPAVVIALVGFTEAAAISRRFAAEDRTRWNADREFVSQGASNVTAGLFGGFPCGGSFTRSAIARASGARTRLAGAISGVAVLLFLPFAGLLEPMPTAVLAGIVIASVLSLLRFRALWALWRVSWVQACVGWGTFAATLLLAPRIDIAVLGGIGASLFVFVCRALRLDIEESVEGPLLRLKPRGVLWFGTAQRLSAALQDALPQHPEVTAVEIDLSHIGRIDITGALVLSTMLAETRDSGLAAEVVNIPPRSRALTNRVLDCEELLP
jgi:SulP family sulfate permease